MTNSQRGEAGACGQVERRDASPRGVAAGMAIAAALLLLGLGVSAALLWHLNRGHAPSAGTQAHAEIQLPAPRLQADPRAERLKLEAGARRRLERGPMPIEQAMGEVVAKGWDR